AEVSPAVMRLPWLGHPLEDSQVHHADRAPTDFGQPDDPASGLLSEPIRKLTVKGRISALARLLVHPLTAQPGYRRHVGCLGSADPRFAHTIAPSLALAQ